MNRLIHAALLLLFAAPAAAQPQGTPIAPVRWEVPYSYPDFIGTPSSVAVGDDGALTIVGRYGNNDSGFDVHAGGSADPLLLHRFGARSYVMRVAAADHAPVAAVFTLMDVDPDPSSFLFEARVHLLEVEGAVTQAWSMGIASGTNWYWDAGGVALSDDGEVVVGWWDLFDQGLARMVALRRDGSLISQADLPMSASAYRTGGVRLSDDGSRALVPTVKTAMLLDVATAAILTQHVSPNGAPLMGIALSGDGRRYATSTWNELAVFGEAPDGSWTKVLSFPKVGDEQYGPVALSQDGRRLAYTIQHFKPEDRFELVLIEVDSQTELFRTMQSEPATNEMLHAQEVVLDDAGRTVACISLGDTELTTPQAFVHDDAGNLLSEHFLQGSGLDVDLDPRGEVVAIAGSPKYGPAYVGGRVIQADPRAPTLRILGKPVLGGSLDVTIAGGPSGGQAVLLASPALGASATPFGILALDLSQRVLRIGPWPIVSGLAQQSLPIPGDPAFAGLLQHYQGLVLTTSGARLTNKVSVRLAP